MSDVLVETETARVVLHHDDDAEPPYDDGSFPILYREYGARSWLAAQETRVTSYVVSDRLIDALNKWHDEPDTFERYARAFHGVTSFQWRDTRDGQYVALDPQEWRDAMGITDEWIDADNLASTYAADMLGEFGAYLDGETYYATIEHKCDMGDWHTVDSLHGLYGEYAREAAYEMWDAETALTLSLCSACVMIDANGEDESLTDSDPTPLALISGYILGPRPCQCSPRKDEREELCESCREAHFSHSPCDGCGQSLAGDRFDYIGVLR